MKGKLLLIFVLSLLLTSQSFSATQIEMLTPDPLPTGVGSQFDVIFRIDMGGANSYGVQIWVTFNTEAMAPVGTAPFTIIYTPGPNQSLVNMLDGTICKYRATWFSPQVFSTADIVKLRFQVIDGTKPHGLAWVGYSQGSVPNGTCYKYVAGTTWMNTNTLAYNTLVTPPDFPLPVLLSSYEGSAGNGFVNLQWVTESEIDNHEFVIYRSSSVNSTERILTRVTSINSNSLTPQVYTYCDNRVDNYKTYYYSLYCSDVNGQEFFLRQVEASPSPNAMTQIAMDFNLGQNYPNPFNNSTTIEFTLHEYGSTTLKLYNIMGEEVVVLFDEPNAAPIAYHISLDGSNLPSGVYFYVLSAPDNYTAKKLVLMK